METQVKKTNRVMSTSLVGKAMDASFEDIRRRAAEGKKVIWANGLPAFTLARATNVSALHVEGFMAGLAARKLEKPLQDAAEDFGMLPDGCSYARSTIGLARIVKGDFHLDSSVNQDALLMPKPDLYVNSSVGCGTARLWGESMAVLCDIPVYHFEPRFIWDDSELEYSMADFIRQERDFIAVLEKLTGQRYDWNRLKELLVEVKKAATLRNEIMELSRYIPAPASFFDLATSIGAVVQLGGYPEGRELLAKVKEEVEQRVSQGIGAVPTEKYRLYWGGIMSWNKLGVLAKKFAEMDACVVAGAYTHLGWWPRPDLIDPEKPLESVAYNCCDTYHVRNMPHRVKDICDLCQKYSIEGLVMSDVQTCRLNNGPNFMIMDGVARTLGLPAITIGGDTVDGRFYNDAQVDTRVQALLETIDARRKSGRYSTSEAQ